MISQKVTHDRFKFGIVKDPDVLEDTFRLRYEVYVDEFGFEKAEDHPKGLEKDNYENESMHFACLKENDTVVGTIRLVMNSEKGFPIENASDISFVGDKPDRSKIAEISRLTVSRDLRRRKSDGQYGVESYIKKKEGGVLPDDGSIPEVMKGRKNPIIVLGLYQVMYQESKRQGLTHWYMISERKLFYSLKKYGFLFHQIGDPVWYHGQRIPYLCIIDELDQELYKKNPDMLKFLNSGLEKKFQPAQLI